MASKGYFISSEKSMGLSSLIIPIKSCVILWGFLTILCRFPGTPPARFLALLYFGGCFEKYYPNTDKSTSKALVSTEKVYILGSRAVEWLRSTLYDLKLVGFKLQQCQCVKYQVRQNS